MNVSSSCFGELNFCSRGKDLEIAKADIAPWLFGVPRPFGDYIGLAMKSWMSNSALNKVAGGNQDG